MTADEVLAEALERLADTNSELSKLRGTVLVLLRALRPMLDESVYIDEIALQALNDFQDVLIEDENRYQAKIYRREPGYAPREDHMPIKPVSTKLEVISMPDLEGISPTNCLDKLQDVMQAFVGTPFMAGTMTNIRDEVLRIARALAEEQGEPIDFWNVDLHPDKSTKTLTIILLPRPLLHDEVEHFSCFERDDVFDASAKLSGVEDELKAEGLTDMEALYNLAKKVELVTKKPDTSLN